MEIIDRNAIDYTVEEHSLFEIINYNEFAVMEIMREIYNEDPLLCHCPLCVEDVFALSLNSLPARYIQVTNLETYENSPGFIGKEKIRNKVLEAIEKVKKGPQH